MTLSGPCSGRCKGGDTLINIHFSYIFHTFFIGLNHIDHNYPLWKLPRQPASDCMVDVRLGDLGAETCGPTSFDVQRQELETRHGRVDDEIQRQPQQEATGKGVVGAT